MAKTEFIIAFDYGSKSIGVAIGSRLTLSANTLAALSAKQGVPDWSQLEKLLRTWQPETAIVGIPLNMDGSEQKITQQAREFAQALKQRYQIPVYGIDERLSTKEARATLFEQGGFRALKKGHVDQLSAVLILQSWFNNPSSATEF